MYFYQRLKDLREDADKTQAEIAGAETAGSGATFSSNEFKVSVEAAYALFAADHA